MLALSSKEYLQGLYFSDQPLSKTINHLSLNTNILSKTTSSIESIRHELNLYFSGHLKRFETPIQLHGSAFQKRAWKALMEVPHGVTRSYTEQAIAMGVPKSYRAIANANHANPIAIVVPCHRIIRANGELSGYAGGVARKRWLILNEKQNGLKSQ
ncbi:methylated-DNA--protein-cysteine methyltransferase [Peziza echinospora]|nr:methylated-DNA--protein-cysteine methyltransferase [Peziza echinospora]